MRRLAALAPEGKVVGLDSYRGGPFRLVYGIVMPLLRAAFLSDAEHRDLLTQAGFTEVATKPVSEKIGSVPRGAGRHSGTCAAGFAVYQDVVTEATTV